MMFKQKKGFLLRDFVTAGILFSLIIALYIIQVASIANNYGNTDIIDQDFATNYNKLSTNLDFFDKMSKAVQAPGGLTFLGTFDIAFNAVFSVVALIWQSLGVYTLMAGSFISDFTFLDAQTISIVLSSLIAIVTVTLVFVWLSSVSRGKI